MLAVVNQPVPDPNVVNTPSTQRKTLRSYVLYVQKKEGNYIKFVKCTGEKMLTIAKNLTDRSFFLHLNSIPDTSDAVVSDVRYHHICWVFVQRNINYEENLLVQDKTTLTGY